MASLGTTKTWIPYMNTKECSQEVCGLYCPQWCYMIFSPPPPYEFPEDSSGSSFSPLAIAIIGILASAFLLVSYYTIISKYCGNRDPSGRGENQIQNVELGEEDHDPSLHEPWHMSTTGLDEALIKSITVFKYNKGDGLIEGTDCSVCLSEFEEDQNVRLLPKCSHAFHVPCIDDWLKSHSSCPLCRANIFFASAPMPQAPRLAPQALMEHPQGNNGNSQTANENVAVPAQNMERVAAEEEMEHNDGLPKIPLRAFSDLGSLQQRDTVIEIRDEGSSNIRRSVSMDHHSFRICAALSSTIPSVAGVWAMNQDELVREEESCSGGFSSSKCSSGAGVPMCKSGHRRKVVQHHVPCPVAMKRSFSSGRFFLSRHARLRDSITPV